MMKKNQGILLVFVIVSFVLIVTGCGESIQNTIGVNALTADPAAFKGEIAVAGVVQLVDAESCVLRIIDEDEYATCGLHPCATAGIIPLYVPNNTKPYGETPSGFIYEGNLPQVEDFVTVIGTVELFEGNYVFEVDRILKGSKVLIAKE